MVLLRKVVETIARVMRVDGLEAGELDLVCEGLRGSLDRPYATEAEFAAIAAMSPPDSSQRDERVGAIMRMIMPSAGDGIILSRSAREMPRLSLILLAQRMPEPRRQELCDLFAVATNALRPRSSS